jgi:hypothetical protein
MSAADVRQSLGRGAARRGGPSMLPGLHRRRLLRRAPAGQQQPNITVIYPPQALRSSSTTSEEITGGSWPPAGSAPDTVSSTRRRSAGGKQRRREPQRAALRALIAFGDHTIYSAGRTAGWGDLHYHRQHPQPGVGLLVDSELTERLQKRNRGPAAEVASFAGPPENRNGDRRKPRPLLSQR